jgi:hypothetical protein
MRTRVISLLAAACVIVSAGSANAAPVVIHFDELAAVNQALPGDHYLAQGVRFWTLNSIPDAVANVGDTFTASVASTEIVVLSNPNAVSPPNFGVARFGGTGDVLMFFPTPITSLSLVTDDATGEVADVVRLFALGDIGLPNFQVLAAASGLDDAISSPANLLSVSLGGTPFQWALFQTTTEQEGFDDVTFTPVPEPTSMVLLGSGLLALGARARKARSAAKG